jgi:hypothetical protein
MEFSLVFLVLVLVSRIRQNTNMTLVRIRDVEQYIGIAD